MVKSPTKSLSALRLLSAVTLACAEDEDDALEMCRALLYQCRVLEGVNACRFLSHRPCDPGPLVDVRGEAIDVFGQRQPEAQLLLSSGRDDVQQLLRQLALQAVHAVSRDEG